MKIKRQNYNEATVIELQGELDSDFDKPLQETVTDIIATGKMGIVLDMNNVKFIDSAGLMRLLWARDYAKENNCQFRLVGLDENCKKILEITRLENEFDRYEELAEAVKSLA